MQAVRAASSAAATLREHRIKFDFVGLRIVSLDSEEMHVEVVIPVLKLLAGSPDWAEVEKAYQDALGELHNGKPEDAITDAAVALEEALKLRGCAGNTLSKKLKDAINKGVLAPHDQKLGDTYRLLGEWLEADRSASGDAHNAEQALRDDGWLFVHIAGALILRLSKGSRTEA